MTNFNVCFENNLDEPPKEVEILKEINGGWDPVGTVPRMTPECFNITSANDFIIIKVNPEGGRKHHQDCDIKTCSPFHECGQPDQTPDGKGWSIEITNSRQAEKTETGTTTVEISDNQP
jgi:hypothetical protein